MSETQQYTFNGRVLPERADVNVSNIRMEVRGGPLDGGELSVSIHSSQVVVVVHLDDEADNIFTLRNKVQEAVYKLTDIFGYLMGFAYDIEITSVVDPDGDVTVFGTGVPVLRNKLREKLVEQHSEEVVDQEYWDLLTDEFGKILELYSGEGGENLRRCLEDFRLSASDPKDTGFFCYRAIETLRHHFKEEEDSGDGASWERLRSALDVGRPDIDYIKENFADARRHGDEITISDEERAKVFETTWGIIDSYVEYLADGE